MPPASSEWALVERQLVQLDTDMRELRSSMSVLVAVNERQTNLLERMNGLQGRVDDHEARLREIEKHLPQLRETRGWLLTAVTSAASAVLALALNHAYMLVSKPAVTTRVTLEQNDARQTPALK